MPRTAGRVAASARPRARDRTRCAAELERAQCSKEFISEGCDRTEESVGLDPADQERDEDHGADDPGDRPRLYEPPLDTAPEESEQGAQLADDQEKRGEHERRAGERRELVGDQLHEEAPGKSE